MRKRKVICLTTGQIFDSGVEASRKHGYKECCVSSNIANAKKRGKSYAKTADGYDWCYLEDGETSEMCIRRVGWKPSKFMDRIMNKKEPKEPCERGEFEFEGLFAPKQFDSRVWEIIHKSEDYKEEHPYKIRNRKTGAISYAAEGELV